MVKTKSPKFVFQRQTFKNIFIVENTLIRNITIIFIIYINRDFNRFHYFKVIQL